MHRECFDLLIKNEINRCPICREENFFVIEDSLQSNTEQLHFKKFIVSNLKYIHSKINIFVFDGSICRYASNFCVLLLVLFFTYIVIGFLACILYRESPNIFSLRFLEIFALSLVEILIILIIFGLFYGTCCKEDEDDYY